MLKPIERDPQTGRFRCGDCHAQPCDCAEYVWCAWFRRADGTSYRSGISDWAYTHEYYAYDGAEKGPVQRYFEPNPFEPKSGRIRVWRDGKWAWIDPPKGTRGRALYPVSTYGTVMVGFGNGERHMKVKGEVAIGDDVVVIAENTVAKASVVEKASKEIMDAVALHDQTKRIGPPWPEISTNPPEVVIGIPKGMNGKCNELHDCPKSVVADGKAICVLEADHSGMHIDAWGNGWGATATTAAIVPAPTYVGIALDSAAKFEPVKVAVGGFPHVGATQTSEARKRTGVRITPVSSETQRSRDGRTTFRLDFISDDPGLFDLLRETRTGLILSAEDGSPPSAAPSPAKDEGAADITISVRKRDDLVTFELKRPGGAVLMQHVVRADGGLKFVAAADNSHAEGLAGLGNDWILHGFAVGHRSVKFKNAGGGLTEPELARLLFETDERVQKLLDEVVDDKLRGQELAPADLAKAQVKRRDILERIWKRELGLRKEAEARANVILATRAHLCGLGTPTFGPFDPKLYPDRPHMALTKAVSP